MTTTETNLDQTGIREMLAGLRFPAARWQVIAQAHHCRWPSPTPTGP